MVSLTPTITEIVTALGAVDRLVGVDEFSVEPAAVKALPKVGSFLEPNLEAIIGLKPDLVLLDRVQEKAKGPLEAAGLRTMVMEMHTIADMKAGIVEIGEALGLAEEAGERSQAIERAVADARSRAAARTGERPVVLAVVDRSPGALRDVVVAGPGSYLDELLAIVGAANAMAASGVRYSNIGAEQILRARPDIILDSVHGLDETAARADWTGLDDVPAIERGRIHLLGHRMFISPSPRADEALRGLEERIYGIRRE